MFLFPPVITLLLLCAVSGSVLSQTAEFPIVSFMGETLPNHSYVDLSQVGNGTSNDRLVCHTDLTTCCTSTQGAGHGDWYFPDGERLPMFRNDSATDPLVMEKGAQQVEVYRGEEGNVTAPPSGIYRCDIEIIDVADHNDSASITTAQRAVYVGLYDSTGGV